MSSPKRPLLHLWLLELATDFFAVAISYFVIYFVRFHSQWGIRLFTVVNRGLGVRDTGELQSFYSDFYLASSFRIVLFITAAVCVLYALFNLYSGHRPIRRRLIAWNVILANTIALAAFYIYFYISRNVFHPRSFFVTVMPVNAAITILLRLVLYKTLRNARSRRGIDVVNTLLVGSGEDATFIRELAEKEVPHGITIVDSMELDLAIPFEETLRQIVGRIEKSGAHMLITAERQLSAAQIMRILEKCADKGIPAKILSEEFSVIANQARIRSDLVKGIPLMHFAEPHHNALREIITRTFDVLLALLLTLALSPILILAALLIKLTSNGPVFFNQERIGVNRKPFTMYKFRTMHHRADELVAQMEEFNESGGGLFKIKQDPRMTSVGKFLRRFSIDELPQLLNVLKGDMSLIGPRPLPRRDFEGYYEDWHYSRHEGLPGITCLWQVSGRSDLDFHSMCILDVYYLRNRNWVLNLRILFRTIHAVLFARGAY